MSIVVNGFLSNIVIGAAGARGVGGVGAIKSLEIHLQLSQILDIGGAGLEIHIGAN